MEKTNKSIRVLELFNKLQNGSLIDKSYEANRFGVTAKTIQRDMGDIRELLEREAGERGVSDSVIYDDAAKGYRLQRAYEGKLSKSEILAICKILLDSRAFTKSRIDQITEKLVSCCAIEEEQQILRKLISNEKHYYVELQNKKEILDMLWKIGEAIQNQNYIEISYEKLADRGKKIVKRRLKPVAIMFSEFYFYMTAFIEDKEKEKEFCDPTIYRINRIRSLKVLDENFRISSYGGRFKEGEFRKRVQFMYGGELRRIKIKSKEIALEAVLDRLPTAKILSEKDGIYTITAEIYGKGVELWLKGQGENVEIV